MKKVLSILAIAASLIASPAFAQPVHPVNHPVVVKHGKRVVHHKHHNHKHHRHVRHVVTHR